MSDQPRHKYMFVTRLKTDYELEMEDERKRRRGIVIALLVVVGCFGGVVLMLMR